VIVTLRPLSVTVPSAASDFLPVRGVSPGKEVMADGERKILIEVLGRREVLRWPQALGRR